MFINIMAFIGGVSLFIYGISNLSEYLKSLSGSKFKQVIDKVVDNIFTSILIGAMLTAIVQSSSAIVVIVIGMVRAGLLNSKQSVGLIMGANIGTTVSAFIVSLPISDYASLILLVGLIMTFLKDKKTKNIGGIILSLGLLFLGLNIMGDGVKPLIDTEFAQNLFTSVSRPTFGGTILGFLFGTGFTAVIQSSSAITAIVQKLYSMNTATLTTITLRGALPIVIGANVGTTITGVLASLGGNEESKRTALVHIIFNFIGALIFLSLIHPFYLVTQFIETNILRTQYSMASLAFAHLIQNTVTTLVLVGFVSQIVKLTELIVPYKQGKVQELNFDFKLIDQSPMVALEFTKVAVDRLKQNVLEYFYLTKEYSFNKNNKAVQEANTYEMIIDELDGKIHNYLIKIMRKGVLDKEARALTRLLDVTKDLERIGDHLSNIVEFFEIRYDQGHDLSKQGYEDLINLYEVLEEMLLDVSNSINNDFNILPTKVNSLEKKVDELEKNAREAYVNRLKSGEFDFFTTSNFTDILSDLERIGDHLNNIASSIIDPSLKDKEITGLKGKEGVLNVK